MAEMTQEKWAEMTQDERFEFLMGHDFKLAEQMGADPDSKVGAVDVSVRYCILCRDVMITGWKDTKFDAYKQAHRFMASLTE